MPNLTVSWDLFIVVFFAVVMSYTFIIGKDKTMHLILAAYVGVIATQGIEEVILRIVGNATAAAHTGGIPMDSTLVALGKMLLFSLCILIVTVRSGMELSSTKEGGRTFGIITTGLLGFSAAGLIASTVLAYAAGSTMVIGILPIAASVIPTAQGGTLMELLIANQQIWFALPAFLIVVTGFMPGE